MTEAKEPPEDSATSKADAMALLEEAEAEAAEAEALAAAARARARAARLRRQALAEAEAKTEAQAETDGQTETEAETETETAETEAETADAEAETEAEAETAESPPPVSDEGVDDTVDDLDAKTDEEAPDETIEAAEPESKLARWRPRLPSLSATAKVAAIVLICVFAGASGYMVWQDHDAINREQRAANFVAGARQGIVNMTSLDFNRAKEDVQRVLDSSTGQFRDDFQQRAKDFTAVVEKSKVVTQGTVNAAAVESMDEHSASVLVSATSRITNSAGAKDEPRAWRLRVIVTEESGQYKMSKVDFVP
jgi:Mce-associated membrane protein